MRTDKIVFCLLSFIGIFSIGLISVIFLNFVLGSYVISFNGKVEMAVVSVSSTEPQYEWSLSGAYICYDPDWSEPDFSSFNSARSAANDRMCGGAYGTSPRRHLPLDEEIKLAFVRPTTIEVAISDPPANVEADLFPRGKTPDYILIIKATSAIESDDECGPKSDGLPIIINITNGRRMIAQLPLEAEIHIPILERTLMPFFGRISLGQSNSADTPNILRSGVLGVYRPFVDIFGPEDPQLVSAVNLFPGDVVRFQDPIGCLTPSAGFLRASEDDQGAYLEVVASVRSQDGAAFVQRPTPGAATDTGHFTVKLRIADAIFTHPLTLWLGAMVTIFVIIKEWASAVQFARGVAPETPSKVERPSTPGSIGAALASSRSSAAYKHRMRVARPVRAKGPRRRK